MDPVTKGRTRKDQLFLLLDAFRQCVQWKCALLSRSLCSLGVAQLSLLDTGERLPVAFAKHSWVWLLVSFLVAHYRSLIFSRANVGWVDPGCLCLVGCSWPGGKPSTPWPLKCLLWLWVRHVCQNAQGRVWKGIFKPQFDLGVTVLLWFVITVLVYFVYQLLNMYWMYAAEYFFGLPAVVSVRLCKVLIIF